MLSDRTRVGVNSSEWVHTLEAPFSGQVLREAFGAFPSGVTTVCALIDGSPTGMAASSFTSVSLDPPLVSLCVARTSTTWPVLRTLPRLGLSVLADGHEDVSRKLAAKGTDRFAQVEWRPSDDGAVFVEGAALWLECTLAGELPAGDHEIALLQVESITNFPSERPLIFHGSQFRRLAI
jgi:flavin reductase (DIM6/NTAB) family NADH-FMN oxidoreductase RutF